MNRVGFGFDLHPLVTGRPLILGGVTVASEVGLDGHSDADVLTHAISEALLGALALGDLGRHFPDTDPRYKGVSSLVLLGAVIELLRARGARLVNVDATVLAQAPRRRARPPGRPGQRQGQEPGGPRPRGPPGGHRGDGGGERGSAMTVSRISNKLGARPA
jgi:2-C-methyl-D-erythritol 2,4-cyclodiphosphate synthase